MINIIIGLLLLNTLGIIIFKPKLDTLNCGIFGWAGKTTNKFNKAKFDLLGSFNESRGEDSCGITIDGDIHIGIKGNKVYKDFLSNVNYLLPKYIPTVIGHTRKSTYGANSAENAHPFGFGTGKNSLYKFIGVHNGTLTNYKELAKKNKIKIEIKDKSSKNSNWNRQKIDSEVLLEIIYRSKNFKVLSKYNGTAALVFTNTDEPNVIYCYHGACKKWQDDEDEKLYEERPLYYFKETRNSLYISSIKKSLEAIGGTNKTVGEFKHNIVYKITDGNINKAELFNISRHENYNFKSINNSYNNSATNAYKRNLNNRRTFDLDGTFEDEDWWKHQGTRLPFQQQMDFLPNKNPCNIYQEIPPILSYTNEVYFNKLRYWKEEKLITGCYVWIPEFGFYFIGHDIKTAETFFWTLVNKRFYRNEFLWVDKDGLNEKEIFVPFKHGGGVNEFFTAPLFYFYKGVRVLCKLDFMSCLENKKDKSGFSWFSLTYCSSHPLIDIDYNFKTSITQDIRLEDKLFDGKICPLGSKRIYTIEDGNCTKIEPKKILKSNLKNEDKKVDVLVEVVEVLEKGENEILENEKKSLLPSTIVTNDLLEKVIDEIFLQPFGKFPADIKRLEVYDHLERATEAIQVLENFLKEAKMIVELEIKE